MRSFNVVAFNYFQLIESPFSSYLYTRIIKRFYREKVIVLHNYNVLFEAKRDCLLYTINVDTQN